MEGGDQKRKAEGDDVSGDTKKRVRGKNKCVAAAVDVQMPPPLEVADEEVDEFFAILKRIRDAVKYFGKVDGESDSGRKVTQALERECSSAVNGNGVTGDKKETEIKKTGVIIDLNMDPNPDDNSS